MVLDFDGFKSAVSRQFSGMIDSGLFCVSVDKDTLWQTYLNSFPEGTNPVFRERTEHDCSCCRSFIRTAGSLVTIQDGKLVSIWDAKITDPAYATVARAMSKLVKQQAIDNQFLHYENRIGIDQNYEDFEGKVLTWRHFSIELPQRRNRGRNYVVTKKEMGPILSEARAQHDVLLRSFRELTRDAVDTVEELIATNSLYRGEEQKYPVAMFSQLKERFDKLPKAEQDNFVWACLQGTISVPAMKKDADGIGGAVAKIRNHSIGTLLIDLSGTPARPATKDEPEKKAKPPLDLEDAVRRYDSIMAPINYKRPTALVSKKQIEAAREKIRELELESALDRRFAELRDIKATNMLYVNRDVRKKIINDVFDTISTKAKKSPPKAMAKVDTISIEKFLKDVVPNAESIEVMLEGRHAGNLVSLIAPADPSAKPLFKWDNNFSWAYSGDMTDSIKEKVKKAGGNVTGDLCCRLAWNNFDDLDLHMRGPNGMYIYFGNKVDHFTHGQLDVDMNAGGPRSRTPVENIFFAHRSRMKEGHYELFVNQFSQRETVDVGFEVEIDFLGEATTYSYAKALRTGQNVVVAQFDYSHANGIKIVHSLGGSSVSKEIWGLKTNDFYKVNVMMYSPNYWDEQNGKGNRHYFFMLDGCTREGQARGFFNEFLRGDLEKHRKVFEHVGSKVKTDESKNQLSGLGFSDTIHTDLLVRVTGKTARTFKVQF